jgi:hypothetical protein
LVVVYDVLSVNRRVSQFGHEGRGKQVDSFSQLLGTFLRKYRSGGYANAGGAAKAERLKQGARADLFQAGYSGLR